MVIHLCSSTEAGYYGTESSRCSQATGVLHRAASRVSPYTATVSYTYSDTAPRVSGDGSTVYFQTNGFSGGALEVSDRPVSSSGGTATKLLTESAYDYVPAPVTAGWPTVAPKTLVALGDFNSRRRRYPVRLHLDNANGKWVRNGLANPDWMTRPQQPTRTTRLATSPEGYPSLFG